jgi:hypothetical protein
MSYCVQPRLSLANQALCVLFPLGNPPWNLEMQGVQPRALLMMVLQVIRDCRTYCLLTGLRDDILQIFWSIRPSYTTNQRGLFSLKEEDYHCLKEFQTSRRNRAGSRLFKTSSCSHISARCR